MVERIVSSSGCKLTSGPVSPGGPKRHGNWMPAAGRIAGAAADGPERHGSRGACPSAQNPVQDRSQLVQFRQEAVMAQVAVEAGVAGSAGDTGGQLLLAAGGKQAIGAH